LLSAFSAILIVAFNAPKFVVAVGDDACGSGILNAPCAVLGAADKIFPVDLKVPGNPPSSKEVLGGLLGLMQKIRAQKNQR